MTLLIFLIFVLVCSAAVKMKFNIRMEEAIVSIIIAIILMTYILGLLSFMYLFVFVLIVTFIIAFKYLIENRQRIEIKEIFTLPTLFYIGILTFIYYFFKNVAFTHYDEFMFWGTNAKAMFYKNTLWADKMQDGVHIVYPPFTAVFEYMLCKIHGGFDEGTCYFALIGLIATFPLLILKDEKYNLKSALKIILTYAFSYILISLFGMDVANLNTDCLQAIIFAIAMIYAYKIKSKKEYVILIMILISMTLIKTNGILFAGIVILEVSLKVVYENKRESNKKAILKQYLPILYMLCAVVIAYFSWSLYCKINGKEMDAVHDQYFLEKDSFINFIKVIAGNEKENNKHIIIRDSFVYGLFHKEIIGIRNMNTTVEILIISNIIYTIYMITNKEKARKFIYIFTTNLGFALYLLSILFIFMFTFNDYQGITLMGFERYIAIYLIAMNLDLVYFILDDSDYESIILVTIITIMCGINIYKSVFDSYELRRAHIEGNIEKATNQILNFVEEDEKIYIVDKSLDGGYGFMQLRYSISPIKTNLLYEWGVINSDEYKYYQYKITKDEYMEKLINESYDYVYIMSVDNEFLSQYGELLDNKALEALYKIVGEDQTNYKWAGILLKLDEKDLKLTVANK